MVAKPVEAPAATTDGSATPAPSAHADLADVTAASSARAQMASPAAPSTAPSSSPVAALASSSNIADDTSVPQQVLTVLTPLSGGDNGSHLVTMALQPEGLGNVQATVTVIGQQVSVSLWADSATGHAALSQTLSQLHSQLSEGSDHQVTVDLADYGSAQPDARGEQAPRREADSGSVVAAAMHDYGSTDGEAAGDALVTGGRRLDIRL